MDKKNTKPVTTKFQPVPTSIEDFLKTRGWKLSSSNGIFTKGTYKQYWHGAVLAELGAPPYRSSVPNNAPG